ncbi:MAG: enoyl-CoA hydratase/isomerase family protein [Desulfobacterales bacterium]|nr:enoyl-CoA hydratase/isomerase family protein [Desulfobacterales bacterium]
MSDPSLIVEKIDRVVRLTLNRPEMKNAMDDTMAEEFAAAVRQIQGDAQARALVITGAGNAFCAGGNLKMLQTQLTGTPEVNQAQLLRFYRSFLSVLNLEIPVIAALRGPAIGAGACLALACDLRIASVSARIGFTFIRLGINPGMGAEFLLTRLIGPARAMELLMTGETITAERAERIGLVNAVVDDSDLPERAMALAGRIAAMPALPLRVIKEQVHAANRQTLDDTLIRAAAFQGICCQSPNVTEGICAVMEKRPPKFL